MTQVSCGRCHRELPHLRLGAAASAAVVSVISTVDTSHEDMIHDTQTDYNGTSLTTCSSDRSVKILYVRNGGQNLIADLMGHEAPVWQVAWAHPMYGNILASCSYDRKVIFWKDENKAWEKTHEHTGHDSSVNSVCCPPPPPGLRPNPGVWKFRWGHLPADLHWGGPMGSEEDDVHTIGFNASAGPLLLYLEASQTSHQDRNPTTVRNLPQVAVTTSSSCGRRKRMASGRRSRSCKHTVTGLGPCHWSTHQHNHQLFPGWSCVHLDL
uniref:Protein SEC13 homolog n=1 Tax=Myotis myotis TaxID=51298 RepID=A0A7J8ALR1_MYOMY|nr:hypothetical protein mMyoMyo1_007969 [Myotis myotis]